MRGRNHIMHALVLPHARHVARAAGGRPCGGRAGPQWAAGWHHAARQIITCAVYCYRWVFTTMAIERPSMYVCVCVHVCVCVCVSVIAQLSLCLLYPAATISVVAKCVCECVCVYV